MLKNTGERLILDQSWNVMTTLEHMHRYKIASSYVRDKTVLDAACGTGYGTHQLSKFAREVYGIDLSPDAVEYARSHFQNDNLHYQVMSVADLKFEDNTFDVITSFETIEHITKDLQIEFLKGIKRMLKKDGVLIMSTPNDQLMRDWTYGAYYNEFHLCEFNEQEYEEFLKGYFKYVKFFYQTVTEASSIVNKGSSGECGKLYSLEDTNTQGRYYVAICSDEPISDEWNLESVLLPKLDEYFDETYYTRQSMLFVDAGEGFSDETKVVGNFVSRDNHSFECEFFIEKEYESINRIRFDLCEHGGKIKVISSVCDGVDVQFFPVNSRGNEDGYDVFMTLDPQYVAQVDGMNCVKRVVIRGEMELLPDHVIITKYEQDCNQLEVQVNKINASLTSSRDSVRQLGEQVDVLTNIIQEKDVEIYRKDELLKDNNELIIQKTQLLNERQNELQKQLDTNKELEVRIQKQLDMNKELEVRMQKQLEDIDQLEKGMLEKQRQIEEISLEKQKLADELFAIQTTRWWKVRCRILELIHRIKK